MSRFCMPVSRLSPARLGLAAVEISQVVRSPELAARLAADYVDPAPAATPEELRKIINAEVEKWEGVAKAGNIRAD